MQLPSLVTILGLGALVAADFSGKINFYYDDNCQDYAGQVTAQGGSGATGGPAGSRSGMFLSLDGQCNVPTYGFESGDGVLTTKKEPSLWSSNQPGTCVTIPSNGGIYAYAVCAI